MPVSARTLTAMTAHASVDTSAAAAKTSTCRNFANEIGPRTPILTSQAPSTRRRELHEEQRTGDGIGNLRREQLVRRHFGYEREPQERGPGARGIQQQEREQGTRGRPEHTHPLGGDEQRKTDANSKKMDRKVDGPRLQGT